jgi:hypothetical protein
MGVVAIVFVLTLLARKMPHVAWLQFFSIPDYRTDEQKLRAERSADMLAGFEMILAGMAAPAVYIFSTIMFFNEPSSAVLLVVGAFSLVFVGLGLRVILRAGRPNR